MASYLEVWHSSARTGEKNREVYLCWTGLHVQDLIQEEESWIQSRDYAWFGRDVKGRALRTFLGRSDLSIDNTWDCLENSKNFLVVHIIPSQPCGPSCQLPRRWTGNRITKTLRRRYPHAVRRWAGRKLAHQKLVMIRECRDSEVLLL